LHLAIIGTNVNISGIPILAEGLIYRDRAKLIPLYLITYKKLSLISIPMMKSSNPC